MKNINNYDKSVLLLIFGLTVLMVVTSTVIELIGFISQDTAWTIDLMAVGWWFGAMMTFFYERLKEKARLS